MNSIKKTIRKVGDKCFYSRYKTRNISAKLVEILNITEVGVTIQGEDFNGFFKEVVELKKLFDSSKDAEDNANINKPIGCICSKKDKKWLKSRKLQGTMCNCNGRMLILQCKCRKLEIPKLIHKTGCRYK